MIEKEYKTMHSNALAIMQKYGLPLLKSGIKVLEVGIGKRFWLSPYRKMAAEKQWSFHFCDMGNYGSDQHDFIRTTGEYSIDCPEENKFDVVISQQTIEHVKNPFKFVAECSRHLKFGGLLVIVCPVTWQHHRNPLDCWRILPDGMRSLFEEAALETVIAAMENLKQDSEDERNEQFTSGPVWDCIGIGKKR